MFKKGLITGLLLITMSLFNFNVFALVNTSVKANAAENLLQLEHDAGALPGGNFLNRTVYWFDRTSSEGRESIISVFYDDLTLAEYQSNIADERLAEVQTLMEQGKTSLAEKAIEYYISKTNECHDNLKQAVENLNSGKFDVSTLKNIDSIDTTFTTQLAVIQNEKIEASDEIKSLIVDKIEPEVQDSIDNTSTIKGEPVLPQDVKDYLNKMKEMGIISEDVIKELESQKNRGQVRSMMNKLAGEGQIPTDVTSRIDLSKTGALFKEASEKYSAYVAMNALKTISMSSVLAAPTQDEYAKIQEFQKNFKPGDKIPDEIKPFVMSQIYGPLLTVSIIKGMDQFDPSKMRSDVDRGIFENIKKNFSFGDSDDVSIKDDKFVMPRNIDVNNFDFAKNFSGFNMAFQNIQYNAQASIAGEIKKFADSAKDNSSKWGNESDFRNQFMTQTGIDLRYTPPGFSTNEYRNRLEDTVRPEAFGFSFKPNGDSSTNNKPFFQVNNSEVTGAASMMKGFVDRIDTFGSTPEEIRQRMAPPPAFTQSHTSAVPTAFNPNNYIPPNMSEDQRKMMERRQQEMAALMENERKNILASPTFGNPAGMPNVAPGSPQNFNPYAAYSDSQQRIVNEMVQSSGSGSSAPAYFPPTYTPGVYTPPPTPNTNTGTSGGTNTPPPPTTNMGTDGGGTYTPPPTPNTNTGTSGGTNTPPPVNNPDTFMQYRTSCMAELNLTDPIDPSQYSSLESCLRVKMGVSINNNICRNLFCKIIPAIKRAFAKL